MLFGKANIIKNKLDNFEFTDGHNVCPSVNHLFTYMNKEKKEYWIRIGVRNQMSILNSVAKSDNLLHTYVQVNEEPYSFSLMLYRILTEKALLCSLPVIRIGCSEGTILDGKYHQE